VTERRYVADPIQPWFAQAAVSAGWLSFYEVVIPGGGRDAGDHHSRLYELQAT